MADNDSQAYDRELIEKTRRLSGINAVVSRLNESTDTETVAEAVIDTLLDVCQFDAARAYLDQNDGRGLMCIAARGYRAAEILGQPRTDTDRGITQLLLSRGDCVVFNDLASDPTYAALAHRKLAVAAGFRSNFYIPILIKQRAVGFFNFLSREPNKFPPEDIELIKAVCQQVGVAFDRAQLFAETKKQATERRQLIDALYLEIRQRSEVEARLRASLAEKETLLKEVHHRVKNNMQVITSLLHLHGISQPGRPVTELLQECEARVASMALVHELLYQSRDLNHIDLTEYLTRLVANLHSLCGTDGGRIEVIDGLHHVRMGVAAAMPCGLILNELISNAFKHAFPDGRRGTVQVGAASAGGSHFTLWVRDDGAGMPAGFDFASAPSLGCQLVGALARQLDGRIETVTGPGTWIKITFPSREVEQVHG